jgi:hypothetical protein
MTTGNSNNRFVGKINAPPPVSTPKNAPWTDVAAIQAALAALSQQFATIITLLGGINTTTTVGGGGGGGGGGNNGGGGSSTVINESTQVVIPIIPNKASFTTGSLAVATITPHTPVQLYSQNIADGYPVTIVANPANAGNIYLGKSQSEVDDNRKRFNGLAPGLAVSLKIKNLSAVWFDADNIGDGVSWIFESDT